jgi:hypothetical protein
MSSIQSAKMNGHDPDAYLKDACTRLPTHRDSSRIEELLLHRWTPAAAGFLQIRTCLLSVSPDDFDSLGWIWRQIANPLRQSGAGTQGKETANSFAIARSILSI